MNGRELAEIRANFMADHLLQVNRVAVAIVDVKDGIKYFKNTFLGTASVEEYAEIEVVLHRLKRILQGRLNMHISEYDFLLEDEKNTFRDMSIKLVDCNMSDDDMLRQYIQHIYETVSMPSAQYGIFIANCQYSYLHYKNKSAGVKERGDQQQYNFLLAGFYPTKNKPNDLIYEKAENLIRKMSISEDNITSAMDGFLFPCFSDRQSDVNSIMYYCRNPKRINETITEKLMNCKEAMSSVQERSTFHSLINNVVGSEMNLDFARDLYDTIRQYVEENRLETNAVRINQQLLGKMLWECGADQEIIDRLNENYDKYMGGRSFRAAALVTPQMTIQADGVNIKFKKSCDQRIETKIVDGCSCLVIKLESPTLSVNGLETYI